MNSLFARNVERLTRVRDFGATHRSSFAANSRAAHLFTSLEAVITELQTLSTTQASSAHSARETTTSVTLAREAVADNLRAISLTARSLAHTTPGLEDKFRRPRKARSETAGHRSRLRQRRRVAQVRIHRLRDASQFPRRPRRRYRRPRSCVD